MNDSAEMLGAALLLVAADDVALLELGLELDDELDDELPQAATPKLAVTASAATADLLLSKCI